MFLSDIALDRQQIFSGRNIIFNVCINFRAGTICCLRLVPTFPWRMMIMGTVPVIPIVHRSSRDAEDSVPYDRVSAFGRKGSWTFALLIRLTQEAPAPGLSNSSLLTSNS